MHCGGFLNNFSNLRECYSYDMTASEWVFEALMISYTSIARMASVTVNGDWWIIGGELVIYHCSQKGLIELVINCSEQGDAVDTVQIWRGSLFRFEEGPTLPERITSACAVNVDDEKVFTTI